MATFTLFHETLNHIGKKLVNLNGATTFKAMLTNTAPVQATSSVKADITEITPATNGYTAGGYALTTTFLETAGGSGVWRFSSNDPTWTASGGSIVTHRYLVVYDDAATNKELIGFVDRGTSDVIADGNTRTWDVGSSGLFEISATP